MKVSEVAGMNLTAREVVNVLGETCSPRTVSKARRGMPEARKRLGWDRVITLSTHDQANLQDLHLKGIAINERKGAEKQYFDALHVWRLAAQAENNGLGSFEQTIVAKTNAMKARALAGNPAIPNALAKLDQKLSKARKSDVEHRVTT